MLQSQPSNKYALAIDIGTGGPKVGLVRQDGQGMSSAFGPVALLFLPGGGAEHEPAEWWSAIRTCVKQVLQTSRISPSDIVAIGATSMWSVVVPVDADGRPLTNAISWMDGRGALATGFASMQGL